MLENEAALEKLFLLLNFEFYHIIHHSTLKILGKIIDFYKKNDNIYSNIDKKLTLFFAQPLDNENDEKFTSLYLSIIEKVIFKWIINSINNIKDPRYKN